MSNNPSISQALGSHSQPTASSASNSKKILQGSNRLYDIPSLENDGSNFQNWKFRARKVLIIRKLWGIVEGSEVKPSDSDPDAVQDWLEKNDEAHAQITLTLKDEPLNGVLHTMLASDAWTKLCERYEGKGKQSIAYLIGELFRGTLSDESPMEPQLNAMH
jgi:hypothetical protein